MPFVVRGETEFAQIVLRIPGGKLRDRVTTPVLDEILGRRISAQSGVGRLASRMLVDIVADVDELGDDECEHIAPAIAEMVAAAVAQCARRRRCPRRIGSTPAIRGWCSRHCWPASATERTVAQVGVELRMSVRYIHNLFTIVGTTPRKWLYDRRIDRACVLPAHHRIQLCRGMRRTGASVTCRISAGCSAGDWAPVRRYRTGPH